ncbi:PBECR2 nuclease fold domain-containing protein [Pyruvatibacter sp.]|uniref:PBECR2 nuclease fold domain-containing protein n=1 Tax=Pyruvatibacter sp. TaxID=1981328 RepID=UPI0032EDBEB4
MAAAIKLGGRPPADAVRFFESKGYQTGFDWRDVWQQEHARAFTVAKAMRLDILQDIRQEVDRAIREGTTLAEFKERLTPALQRKGWWGRQSATDPVTGEIRTVQLGSPRRLATIYDTNLRMSHAAGRWARVERNAARRPYLVYRAVMDDRTRDEHRQWHDIVRPWDDAFWDTHYPPNGWHCRCIVRQMGVRDLKRNGLEMSSDADVQKVTAQTKRWRNKRTGAVEQLPVGIAPGFNYNVGKAHMRGLTPPPRSGPLPVPAIINNAATVPMPPPRNLPPGIEFDGTPEQKMDMFLQAFGASRSKPAVFTDVIGERLVISDALFKTADGTLKIGKRDRVESLAQIALTIMQPDEIWWYWEKHRATDTFRLRRRYLMRGRQEGDARGFVAAFDVGADGWVGITAHPTNKPSNLMRSRMGVLAYRRSD